MLFLLLPTALYNEKAIFIKYNLENTMKHFSPKEFVHPVWLFPKFPLRNFFSKLMGTTSLERNIFLAVEFGRWCSRIEVEQKIAMLLLGAHVKGSFWVYIHLRWRFLSRLVNQCFWTMKNHIFSIQSRISKMDWKTGWMKGIEKP